MTRWLGLVLCLLVISGCAHRAAPVAEAPELLHDELFTSASASATIDARDIFALSAEMVAFSNAELSQLKTKDDPRRSLLDALNQRRLKLTYDTALTRNAAQAFEARAGNCLSLVIMTAAFAKHLNLPYGFQTVHIDELYSRSGDLTLSSGHVNLVLERLNHKKSFHSAKLTELIVDFLPPSDLRGYHVRTVSEATIVAMYLNNRAAEHLASGKLDEAYHFARAAVLQDREFGAAINTLAVIYLRRQHVAQAEAALQHLLQLEPSNTAAWSNLVLLLHREGRQAEAEVAQARLHDLQPLPPLYDFDRGRQAFNAGDLLGARDHFARELRRQPFQPEVHFWSAITYLRLGESRQAEAHLRQAVENSSNVSTHDLYAAKLASLRAKLAH